MVEFLGCGFCEIFFDVIYMSDCGWIIEMVGIILCESK